MTYFMVALTKKIIRGRPYYYARECKRVDGKPKIVWQKYLGRAEDIVAAVVGSAAQVPVPKEAAVAEFGAVVALYDLARRLELVDTIDAHVPKGGAGPSVGTYLLVAILNRCVAPCSKAAIGAWFSETVLRRLVDIEPRQLTSQRFWDNMDRIPSEALAAIERDLVAHAVARFGLDVRRVLFDATNFFTFIDSFNARSALAQRGHSKEGRASLRIVGVALLVTADFHVPLLHRTYPGNQPDAPTFASLTADLAQRVHQVAAGAEDITLVFDKGNNSAANLDAVEGGPFHFVGSLVPTQHADLLAVPLDRFRSLQDEGLPRVRAFRTRKRVFGVERTVVVAHNDNLFVAQSKTLLREIARRQRLLQELGERLRLRQQGLVRGGKPPTVAGVRNQVRTWLKARHMKELFEAEVTEGDDGLPHLDYRFRAEAWEELQRTLLGKTLVFTDRDDWSDADIVRAYRAQHHVEDAFRAMKDTDHIALRPQHHWTDHKVEVHVFCCIVALMLCSLLRRELHIKGIDRSIAAAIDELAAIREVTLLYPPGPGDGTPRLQATLSTLTPERSKLFGALELHRYAPA